jgi:hypothetical protein
MKAVSRKEYIRYAVKRMRSAIAPETIVAAVPAKTAWKSQNTLVGSVPVAGSIPAMNQPLVPKSGPSPPYAIAYPKMKKPSAAKQKSIRFFISTLAAFFDRMRPVSTMPKPACMKNTIAAAISTQSVSSPSKTVSTAGESCDAIAGPVAISTTSTPKQGYVRFILDPDVVLVASASGPGPSGCRWRRVSFARG